MKGLDLVVVLEIESEKVTKPPVEQMAEGM